MPYDSSNNKNENQHEVQKKVPFKIIKRDFLKSTNTMHQFWHT